MKRIIIMLLIACSAVVTATAQRRNRYGTEETHRQD